MSNTQKRLGKGLEALLGQDAVREPASADQVLQLSINQLDPNPNQPRQQFDADSLGELTASVAMHGILQPILVAPGRNGRYTIIAGERRWRAARNAGLTTVPAILRRFEDQQLMEVSLIENLQRSDLNPVEEAEAIRLLMESYHMTQEEVATRVGKSRPAIANALRLLALPPQLLALLRDGRLTAGHARALLSITDPERQQQLAERILQTGMSVRQAEKWAAEQSVEKKPVPISRDLHIASAEKAMRNVLGTKVKLSGTLERGKIVIEYFNRDDLERIYEHIAGKQEA